jgi:hypothetical protein
MVGVFGFKFGVVALVATFTVGVITFVAVFALAAVFEFEVDHF